MAYEIDRHSPGPPFSARLELLGDVPADEQCLLLFRRAFSDLDVLQLRKLQGGMSGAAVWEGRAGGRSAGLRPHPFLVKHGPLAKIRDENQRFSQFVKRRRHWRNVPDFIDEWYVEGSRHGLLVQEFIDSAWPFAEAVIRANPAPLIANLFEVALAGCHGAGGPSIGRPFQAFTDLKALKWDRADLQAAAARAKVIEPLVLELEDFRRAFESLPAIPYRRGLIHGDLHQGNLFVHAGSSDVLVVDFANAAYGPVVADHACLEVSLAFPIRETDCTEPVGYTAWLDLIYEPPLCATQVAEMHGGQAGIAAAIRAIRANATAVNGRAEAYDVAVAAYLIRFAAFGDQAVTRRAHAYILAAHLLQACSDLKG